MVYFQSSAQKLTPTLTPIQTHDLFYRKMLYYKFGKGEKRDWSVESPKRKDGLQSFDSSLEAAGRRKMKSFFHQHFRKKPPLKAGVNEDNTTLRFPFSPFSF